VSGLAHYLEREAIPTVVISLIREHTARMKPPRALSVPFQLGRPFGAPGVPDFQRQVLITALGLLERTDGPILEDFPEAPPDEASGESNPNEGWACPINLSAKPTDLGDAERFKRLLKDEIALLRPWYDESARRQQGRRLDGLTAYPPETIVDHLVSYLDDPGISSFVPGEPLARAIKLCADDLKFFYYQAAMARPAGITGIALDNWFFGETLAGALHFELRRLLLTMQDPALRRVGEMSLVPHTMLHHLHG
jgi:hypothetical protein